MQKSYSSFIESVCKKFDCTDAIRPLQEGFDALCESMTPGNQELVRYFRNLKPSSMQKDFSEMDGDVFTKHNPHFDRWVVHNTENAPEIYENGFRYGSEPGKLAYTDHYDSGRFAFATPLENATPPNFDENRPLPYCDTFDVGGSIVFKASGVTAFHKNDREDEVIFDKDSPEGCFWIRNVNHRAWENDTVDDESDHELVDRYEVIGNNPDRPLCTGTYDRCIRWCRDNGDAYAHMMKRWKARGNATKTESMMTVNANSLCQAGDCMSGSAWDTVERIHVYHAADHRLDMDIKLDSPWATGQKYSATRQDVINRFVEDAEDFNKWLATSEDGGAFITSASIKFKGEPDAITVDIPCPVGVDDLVSCNCQLRQPTTDELYKFIMKATKEEHQLRGDWDSNHEEIGADFERFIQEIQTGEVQSLTDGRGLVAYGLDNGKMFIYDLYVLPEYRNAGVGGTLLDKVIEVAGGRPVALTVNSMNAQAIQLYRNHGFREVGTVSDNGVELLRMERKPVPEVDADVEQRPAR